MLKQACLQLRAQGYSIGQIARRLSVSKSSVHWHVRKISLTLEQKEALRQRKQRIMAVVNGRRRGKALQPRPFLKPRWSQNLIHLVSHLAFDGRVDRYGCHYYSRNKQQVEHVQKLLKCLLQIEAKIYQRSNGIWTASYHNVETADWLSHREAELELVTSRSPRWRQTWLRAFFDDEGHVHFAGSIRRVRASQDRPEVLRIAREFLDGFHIASRIDMTAHAVEITGRENLERFHAMIGFSPGIQINPARRNGIWKTAIDKQELLSIALQSYLSVL